MRRRVPRPPLPEQRPHVKWEHRHVTNIWCDVWQAELRRCGRGGSGGSDAKEVGDGRRRARGGSCVIGGGSRWHRVDDSSAAFQAGKLPHQQSSEIEE